MQIAEIARQISAKDFKLPEFVQAAMQQKPIRDEIVRLMLTDADIMVYYHTFYIVSHASEAQPALFYPYWPAIAPLLKHPNSYHRDFALTILANLTAVDTEHLFKAIYQEYFAHLHDPKFMTARCCVQQTGKVLRHTPDLRETIMMLLLNFRQHCPYPAKQQALLAYDVLAVVAEVYADFPAQARLNQFIRGEVQSLSPKTRTKAKELSRKYHL
jgi:hypothetical protein